MASISLSAPDLLPLCRGPLSFQNNLLFLFHTPYLTSLLVSLVGSVFRIYPESKCCSLALHPSLLSLPCWRIVVLSLLPSCTYLCSSPHSVIIRTARKRSFWDKWDWIQFSHAFLKLVSKYYLKIHQEIFFLFLISNSGIINQMPLWNRDSGSF